MSKNFMQSTSELCFADRDFLPSFCRTPERRTSYRSNPDTDEAQRFFGSESEFEYLLTADSRQDLEDDLDSDDNFIDEGDDFEEHLVGAWAELDADDAAEDASPEEQLVLDEPTALVTTSNIEPMHPVEITRARLRRCISRNGGRQPRRIHDDRTTIRRG